MWDKKSHWKEESEKEVNWEKEEDSEEKDKGSKKRGRC